jgi:hypothetical protein
LSPQETALYDQSVTAGTGFITNALVALRQHRQEHENCPGGYCVGGEVQTHLVELLTEHPEMLFGVSCLLLSMVEPVVAFMKIDTAIMNGINMGDTMDIDLVEKLVSDEPLNQRPPRVREQ